MHGDNAKEFVIPDGHVRVALRQDSRTHVDAEYPPNEKWSWRAFSGWRQDTQDWSDEGTGETFPATFAWIATFKGMRVHPTPEACYFYLRIRVSGEKDKPLDRLTAELAMEQGAKEFDSYADCACVVGKNCERHGGELARR